MNTKALRTLFAAPAAAIVVTTSATLTAPAASAGSVWEDALLWFNGPVDANGDGKWTGNVSATDSGVSGPRKCDGTGGGQTKTPDDDAKDPAQNTATRALLLGVWRIALGRRGRACGHKKSH